MLYIPMLLMCLVSNPKDCELIYGTQVFFERSIHTCYKKLAAASEEIRTLPAAHPSIVTLRPICVPVPRTV
jgi:hypothetical protein